MDRHTNKYFTDRQNDFESSARSYPRKFPVALTKAKGSWVEDADGKRCSLYQHVSVKVVWKFDLKAESSCFFGVALNIVRSVVRG